ncbi:MAG: SDR family NAD(P)-dependent oxidoreductase [Mariniblastus sp.]
MGQLENKTILVTGASRGIGAAIARKCAHEGATVIAHSTAPSDASASVEAELGIEFIYQDLSQSNAGAELFAKALSAGQSTSDSTESIDGVVNNAGVYLASPLSNELDADWETNWAKTMRVNVQAPADICRAAIAHFRQRKTGSVVNIASRAGHRGDGGDHAAYAASKGAVLAMTKTWARALAGEGLRFYAIAPGWVETRMAPEDIAKRAAAVSEIPIGRVAQPEEVAELTVFLLSDACPSAVGATFDINGASYVR